MPPTIKQACEAFLDNIKKSKPRNTYVSYKSDLLGATGFIRSLAPGMKASSPVDSLTDRQGVDYIQSLLNRGASVNTRRRCASSLRDLIRFIDYNYDLNISVDKLDYGLKAMQLLYGPKNRSPYPGEKIQRILDFTKRLSPPANDLLMHRDLAFIWSLAETGMRVSEACNLKIGQIDREWRASFIGKRDKERTVLFGKNSRLLITIYLKSRRALDESTKQPRSALPLFSRHDKTSGKDKVKPINPKNGEAIVHNMASLALGDEYDDQITCHRFRHYYVSSILRKKGIKAAQIGAGHENIATTEIYAHLNAEEVANINKDVFG